MGLASDITSWWRDISKNTLSPHSENKINIKKKHTHSLLSFAPGHGNPESSQVHTEDDETMMKTWWNKIHQKTASVVLSCRVSELSAPKKHQQKNEKWRCGFYKKKKESAASRWFEIKLMWEVELLQPPAWLSLDFFCVRVCVISLSRDLKWESCLKPQPSSPMMCRHWWDLCWLGSKKIKNKDAVSAKADRKGEKVKDGEADEQNGLKRNKTMKRLDEKQKLKEGGWVNRRGRLRR